MLQENLVTFWRQHNSTMQEVLTLQGGDNRCSQQVTLCNTKLYDHQKTFVIDHCLKKGEHLVFTFIKMNCFDVHIFDEFRFEKVIPRGLSSQRLKQQLDYIQLGQDDDIAESRVSKKQKPSKVGMHENGTQAHSPNVQNDTSTNL